MKWLRPLSVAVLVLGLNTSFYGSVTATVPGNLGLVSSDSSGTIGNGHSGWSSMSSDARFVVYDSAASNLVSNDTNYKSDIFVKDTTSNTTERISISTSGTESNADSSGAVISADGRYVAFNSTASNLVASDTNSSSDVFVRDRLNGTTKLVSQSSGGSQGNGYSGLASQSAISNDGRFIVFDTLATNLVSGDSNSNSDVLVRDTKNDTTKRINVADNGAEANGSSSGGSISGDGRYIVYHSNATNLVASDTNGFDDTFLADRVGDTTQDITILGNDHTASETISNDGQSILILSAATNLVSGDTNNAYDDFVFKQSTGTFSRVSLSNTGAQINSDAASSIAISGDGKYVAFVTAATNVTSDDTDATRDAFLRDITAGTTQLLSKNSSPAKGNGNTWGVNLSSDGTNATMWTDATNLAPSDSNNKMDVITAETGNSAGTYCPE